MKGGLVDPVGGPEEPRPVNEEHARAGCLEGGWIEISMGGFYEQAAASGAGDDKTGRAIVVVVHWVPYSCSRPLCGMKAQPAKY